MSFVILLSAGSPVDIRTINARTKDVHERTFIFSSIWKHEKRSELVHLMNVSMRYVLKTLLSFPWFFFCSLLTWKFLNLCNVLPTWENWEQKLQIQVTVFEVSDYKLHVCPQKSFLFCNHLTQIEQDLRSQFTIQPKHLV